MVEPVAAVLCVIHWYMVAILWRLDDTGYQWRPVRFSPTISSQAPVQYGSGEKGKNRYKATDCIF